MKDTFGVSVEIGHFVMLAMYGSAWNPYQQVLCEVVAVFEDTCKVIPLDRAFNKLKAVRSVSMPDSIVVVPDSIIPQQHLEAFKQVESAGE